MSDGPQSGHGWGQSAVRQPTGYATGEPDWIALADQHEQQSRRRKQRQVIGAVVGATLVIGGITATAVGLSGSGHDDPAKVALAGASSAATDPSGPATGLTTPTDSPSAQSSPSASASASASPSAGGSAKPSPKQGTPNPSSAGPRDPLTVISSATTDTAPLDPAGLFAATTLTFNGHTWTRLTVQSNSPCWQATTGHLGDAVTPQGCHALLRATYTSGNSAVTVGVAVFDSRAQADAANQAYEGQIQGLVPSGNTSFCVTAGCTSTHGAVGRYDYYTVSGTVKPGGNTADATATAAGPNFAGYARGQLLARGK